MAWCKVSWGGVLLVCSFGVGILLAKGQPRRFTNKGGDNSAERTEEFSRERTSSLTEKILRSTPTEWSIVQPV